MAITAGDIEQHIYIMLGGSDVEIDLTAEDHAYIVTQALSVLSTNKPVERLGILHVLSGVQKYQMDANTWGRGVIKVSRALPSSPIYNAWPFPDPYVVSVPVRHLGDYALSFTHWKEAEYLFGSNFEFTFDRTTGILMLKPPPIEGGNYGYVYLDDYTLDDVQGRRQWILDYSLALAKMIVGSKWRKFRNFPGNENQVELYTEIYDEGKEEAMELREKIERAGAASVPPAKTYRQG